MPATTRKTKPAKRLAVARGDLRPLKPRTPPPAKCTAADLLKVKDFGKGLDGDVVEKIITDRAA